MQNKLADSEVPQGYTSLDASSPTGDHADRETVASAVKDFSIVLGGPVYNLLLRFHLIRQTVPNMRGRFIALLAVIWLPLLALSLREGMAFGHSVRIPFLYDFAMYGRFLFGLPLLLFAELLIDPVVRQAVSEFVNAGLVPDQELPAFENILRRVQQIRDSWIPEAILLVLAFFPTFLFQHEWVTGALTNWHTTAQGMSAAGWWYAMVSAPVMRYIAYRWVFRYFLWPVLLWKISKLRLILIPTHPDRAAGVNFLAMSQRHFGILACALACSVAGRVANMMVFEGAHLASFKYQLVGFVVLSVILGVLPLALWVPKLMDVRKNGLLQYGRFAETYTKSFDRKWIHCGTKPAESMLGTPDLQSLADLGNSFFFIENMRKAPITRKLIQQLAVRTALPFVPIVIFGTPTAELIEAVMKLIM